MQFTGQELVDLLDLKLVEEHTPVPNGFIFLLPIYGRRAGVKEDVIIEELRIGTFRLEEESGELEVIFNTNTGEYYGFLLEELIELKIYHEVENTYDLHELMSGFRP